MSGAGRPLKGTKKRVTKSLVFDADLYAMVELLKVSRPGMSRSEIINEALRPGLVAIAEREIRMAARLGDVDLASFGLGSPETDQSGDPE